MVSSSSKLILLAMFANLLLLGEGKEVKNEGRDFHGYLPPEEHKTPDYQLLQYPHNYPFREDYEECVKNPMLPLLGKGLNLILLKLGVFGIIKAVIALIIVGFLFKIPLLLLKMAFLKSFFLPLLVAPLFLQVLTSQMQPASESNSPDKPEEMPSEMMPGIMSVSEMTADMGRQLNDNLTSVAWQSMKMFAESEKCVERISCMIGASSRDSSMGTVFSRILKYLHFSSPLPLQKRLSSIREAFNKGSRSSACLAEDYECQSPELLLQYGIKKIKIL